MPTLEITRESKIVVTPRVLQARGIFDVPPSEHSVETWRVAFEFPAEWSIGAIVGPSGAGKTTLARELFGDFLVSDWDWPGDKSLLDGFPAGMSIKEITGLLSSVGFSSPPSWLRPFHVLSNGEQFRVLMARTLSEMPSLAVVDEFTSVVDRTVARIGSAAVAKSVRKRGQQFVAVTCHYDVLDWLEPDWVYQPHTGEFLSGRDLHQRPSLTLDVRRVHPSAWSLFRKHHYLSAEINNTARCFCAFIRERESDPLERGTPVAFTAWLPFPHPHKKNVRRAHRTVCLPDYQGIGIGNALVDYIAACVRALGYSAISTTSSPSMVYTRARSTHWKMTRGFALNPATSKKGVLRGTTATDRLTAAFEFVGPALEKELAHRLWDGV